jgi:mediator of RNA polymerase II transcription subunit 5
MSFFPSISILCYIRDHSLLIGDDAKVAREAQMMHTIQMALGKGDLLGPNSETDIITFSLLLHNFVGHIQLAFNCHL